MEKDKIMPAIILIAMLGAICLALWVNSYPEERCAPYPQITDTNTTDQNIIDANTLIEDVNTVKADWCRKEYLHRNDVRTINTLDRNTGEISKMTWREAIDLNIIVNGQFIPMENIEDANGGVFCEGFIYYGVRAVYTRCLDFNTTLREECFLLPTSEIATLPSDWNGQRWNAETKNWE